jgi:hypothetical protein
MGLLARLGVPQDAGWHNGIILTSFKLGQFVAGGDEVGEQS